MPIFGVDEDILWDIIQNGFNKIYQNGDSVEYGAAAVGMLIG